MTMYTDMVQAHAMTKPYARPAGPPLIEISALGVQTPASHYALLKRLLEQSALVSAICALALGTSNLLTLEPFPKWPEWYS